MEYVGKIIFMKACPICKKSNNIFRILNIKNFPIINTPIKIKQKKTFLNNGARHLFKEDLKILLCKNCFHTYLEKIPNQKNMDKLYSKFYNYPSPLIGKFKPQRDINFLNFLKDNKKLLLNKKINKIFEIGCFDGYILYKLKKMGFDVSGCEPSKGADIGKKFGLNIYKRFFKSDFFLKKKIKFDLVFSRHFLEHMVDPAKILIEKIKVLEEKGFLIIEVPNIQYYLKKSLLEVFSLQHIHGFSLNSISILLRNYGFKILKVNNFSENLIIVSQKRKTTKKTTKKIKTFTFKNYIKKNKNLIHNKIGNYIKNKKKIIFWGAGGFSVAAVFLYGIKEKHISYIIDSDNKKKSMQFLHNSLKISSISKLVYDNPDLIIITSYYSSEILKTIKKMKLNVDVLKIFPKPILMKIKS